MCPVCLHPSCLGPVNGGYHHCIHRGCYTQIQGGRRGFLDHLRVVHGKVPSRKPTNASN